MGWVNLSLPLLAVLAGLLVAAGIEDARTRQIGNGKNLAIALLAPLWWWSMGLAPWPDMAVQLLAATIVFALFVGVFAMGWMGGGDVKLIGALALWLPLGSLAQMLVVMSLVGGGVTAVLMIERCWRRSTAAIEVPYGVAIAIAGLLALREPILNHFA